MMRKLIIITIVCLGFGKVTAQDYKKLYGSSDIKSLHIGDQVPDFTIPKLMNSVKESVKISDFKDQLLIIDFWHTGCSSCIQGLPHMEAMQKQFGDKIKILPSTFQVNDIVFKNWWKNNKYTKNLTIPTVVEDKLLLSYFPHRSTPHEVWVYKEKVIAFTDADYITADNIEKVLSGATITWPVKDDFYTFDGRKQLLFLLDSNQVNVKSTFVKYAAIDGFRESIGTSFAGDGKVMDGIVRDPIKKTVRYFNANFPAIYNLYRINFSYSGKENYLERPQYGDKNQTIWEVSDPYKYALNEKLSSADLFRKNGVCFESLNTDTGQTDQQVYESVITDLNRLLGLNVRWEKRKEKVLVLIRTSKTDERFKNKRKIPRDPFENRLEENYVERGDLHQFREDYLGSFVGRLNNINTNPYVYDSTGYDGPIDMDLRFSSWTDIAGIRKALAPYGLDLKEEERLVDKLVFTEVNGGLLVDLK